MLASVLFVGTTVVLIVGSTASDVDRGINGLMLLIVGSMACDVDREINGQECCSREQRTNDNVD